MKDIILTINESRGSVTLTPPKGYRIIINQDIVADDDILSLREAADEYGLNQGTLASQCKTGRLPCVLKGGVRMVKREDLEHMIANPLKPGRKPKQP